MKNRSWFWKIILMVVFSVAILVFFGEEGELSKTNGANLNEKTVQSARLTGDLLLTFQSPTGKFFYAYSPRENRMEDVYDWAQHCLAGIALLRLYQETRELKFLQSAERAFQLVRQRVQSVQIGNKQYQVLVSKPEDTKSSVNVGDVLRTDANAALVIFAAFLDESRKESKWAELVNGILQYLGTSIREDGEAESRYFLDEKLRQFSLSRFPDDLGIILAAFVEASRVYGDKISLDSQDRLSLAVVGIAKEMFHLVTVNDPGTFLGWGLVSFFACLPRLSNGDIQKGMSRLARGWQELLDGVKKSVEEAKNDPQRQRGALLLERRFKDLEQRKQVWEQQVAPNKDALYQVGKRYLQLILDDVVGIETSRYRGVFLSCRDEVAGVAVRWAFLRKLRLRKDLFHESDEFWEMWKNREEAGLSYLLLGQYQEAQSVFFKSSYPIVGGVREYFDMTKKGGDVVTLQGCSNFILAMLGW